jgi:hypothetical protein
MSGYGTQKMETTDLNLGFPSAYQSQYRMTARFAPDPPAPHPVMLMGEDFQSNYHEQKRRDADYMVRAKVIATRNMNNRANVSHAGYYEMPKAVLGQRKFANPSNGDIQPYSARYDNSPNSPWHIVEQNTGGAVYGAGLEGGVLRTPSGMAFGKQKLFARIKQLNDIADAKQNFFGDEPSRPTPFAGAEAQPSEKLAFSTQVQLAETLQEVLTILTIGINFSAPLADLRALQQQTAKAFAPIIRMATTGSVGDINDVLEYIQGGQGRDGIAQLLADTYTNIMDRNLNVGQPGLAEIIKRLVETYQRIEEYLEKMVAVAENPAKDRENASKALVKTLKFTQASRDFGDTSAVAIQTGEENREFIADLAGRERPPQTSGAFIAPNAPQARRSQTQKRQGQLRMFDEFTAPLGASELRDALSTFGVSTPRGAERAPSEFSRPGMRREDSEHGAGGGGGAAAGSVRFSANTRDGFGAGLGAFGDATPRDPLGRMPAYLGEDNGEFDDADALAAAEGLAEGGDEDEEDVAASAAMGGPMRAPGGGLRAVARDEVTGEANIDTGAPLSVRAKPKAEAREIVVPDWRNPAALRAFITDSNATIEGFSHKPQASSQAKMIRQAVVQKLQKLGYTTLRG